MHRNLAELARTEYDLLIIGGGAAGAAAAREATLRGLKVALIERHDFGSGASAHCFKVIHGGIRYLQHGDIRRMRDASYERSVFLRLAPHLVKPLPFVMPTYGFGRRSRWFLGAGMLAYDLLSADRNLQINDPSRRVRATRFFSRDQTLTMFPTVPREGLTGAAAFEDGQMHNPPRLVLSFVLAAQQLGAQVANYVEAERLLIHGKRVHGVAARDVLTGERFDIRARVVLNAAGPWAEGLLKGLKARTAISPPGTWSRDACFVINRRPTGPWALALPSMSRDSDAVLTRGARHLFMAPWRDRTLVGVWHSVVPPDSDAARVTPAELGGWIDEINASHPGFELRESEVERVDFGLVPFGAPTGSDAALSFGRQSRLIDHQSTEGIAGLVTSISVRFTVARLDAVRAIGCVMRQLRRGGLDVTHPLAISSSVEDPERLGRSRSASEPLPGGGFDDFEQLLAHARRNRPSWLPNASVDSLVANFGTHMHQVIALAEADASLRRCVAGTHVTLAEVAYSIRNEMVQTLNDLVFRRSELGTAGHPGDSALREVAHFMQQALGWDARRCERERETVEAEFSRFLTRTEPTRHVSPVLADPRLAPEPSLLTTAI